MNTRQLTPSEIASFLARHPIIATRVAETKMAMFTGFYDFNYYDHIATTLKFPGVIEPRGLQVQDSQYGLVTIQPAPAGMFFTGWSPVIGDAEKENYVSTPAEGNIAADIMRGLLIAALAAGIGYAVVNRIGKQ